MIRPGKSSDAFALASLLEATYYRSRYYGEVGFRADLARKLFAMAAQRHGGTTDGATWLMVSDVGSDETSDIDGFILGQLSRIYMVGEKLCASDVFLICDGADARVMGSLVDGYVEWAESNPRVYEIGLSWSDTLPSADRMKAVFGRRGFQLCGESYRRTVRTIEQVAA